MKRIGVDVGGTFTDFIYVDDNGKIEVYKTSTTPHDPSIGMMEGINLILNIMKFKKSFMVLLLLLIWFLNTRVQEQV